MYVLHVLALGLLLWPHVYLLFFLNFFSSKFLSFSVRVRLGIGSGMYSVMDYLKSTEVLSNPVSNFN